MPEAISRKRSFWITFFMGLFGAVVGTVLGCSGAFPRLDHAVTHVYPLPHHFPKYPGGVSLRFAMVHDVIHERFARHGPAYYQERNRLVRQALAPEKSNPPTDAKAAAKYFALFDDLGAGLDALGQDDEAVEVLRDKLRQQQSQGYEGRQLYTTYANLGTFLIHGNFQKAREGNGAARARLREGLQFIHQSIEVNAQAHFGREIWQAVAVEFFLAAMDKPQLLLTYDLVGNRLDRSIDPGKQDCLDKHGWVEAKGDGDKAVRFLANATEEMVKSFRRNITLVGADEGWTGGVRTSHQKPVPFDEPTLGIIGMWRLGGGANPHFALALGEIMMRVGQRHIAWCAYERAVLLADKFWPDRKTQKQFVTHCRRRQAIIEEELTDADEMRTHFEAELKHGLHYQRAYQEYEAEGIKQGASIDDPHFYDAFQARHGKMASPVGNADRLVIRRTFKYAFPGHLAILFAGLFAFGTACFLRFRKPRLG